MALAQTVDSLDSVPEAARGAYVEKDGKFHLDFEFEDTAGLKSALAAERALNKTQKTELASFKKSGKTAAEIAEFVEAQEAAAADAAKKSGNFDAILGQHKATWATEKTGLETELAAARNSERSAIIETSVMGALTKAKATVEGVDLLTERLGKRIKFETVDGKRKIQIMQADGETPMAGKGADGAATFDDLVTEAVKTWPSLFEGTGAGGGGTPSKQGGKPGDKTLTLAQFHALGASDRAAKMKDGFKVVD